MIKPTKVKSESKNKEQGKPKRERFYTVTLKYPGPINPKKDK